MSTIYAQRSSAVRAAKKAANQDQEWVIIPVATGFTFQILGVGEKQPKEEEVLATLPQGFNHNTSEGRQAATKTIAEKVASGEVKVNIAKERKAAQVLAETGATEQEHAAHRAESTKSTALKPFQLAKQIVSDCVSRGITSRKEIIAACVAQGIKLNTADGAHYELCVRKS